MRESGTTGNASLTWNYHSLIIENTLTKVAGSFEGNLICKSDIFAYRTTVV